MSRQRLAAAACAAPAVVLAVIGAWAVATNIRGGWLWPPDAVTISEAAATGNHAELLNQIETGVDPNRPASVRRGLLGDAPMRLTPLQAAVRARSPLAVRLLIERGVVITPAGLATLKCMNDENGNAEVRALLDALPTESTIPCSEVSIPD